MTRVQHFRSERLPEPRRELQCRNQNARLRGLRAFDLLFATQEFLQALDQLDAIMQIGQAGELARQLIGESAVPVAIGVDFFERLQDARLLPQPIDLEAQE